MGRAETEPSSAPELGGFRNCAPGLCPPRRHRSESCVGVGYGRPGRIAQPTTGGRPPQMARKHIVLRCITRLQHSVSCQVMRPSQYRPILASSSNRWQRGAPPGTSCQLLPKPSRRGRYRQHRRCTFTRGPFDKYIHRFRSRFSALETIIPMDFTMPAIVCAGTKRAINATAGATGMRAKRQFKAHNQTPAEQRPRASSCM